MKSFIKRWLFIMLVVSIFMIFFGGYCVLFVAYPIIAAAIIFVTYTLAIAYWTKSA